MEQPEMKKAKMDTCQKWLQKQKSQVPKKLSQKNKNDIKFIIQTNAARRKFMLSAAEDVTSVPAGVDEPDIKPRKVPIHCLRKDKLHMECEWKNCQEHFGNYAMFQQHVSHHIEQLAEIDTPDEDTLTCLWDICGFSTLDMNTMVRHVNYHAYHTRLKAIGFNARATLNLLRCRKDSSLRNQLPSLQSDHECHWTGCGEKFDAIQNFFDHVHEHVKRLNSDEFICSWAGCGSKFSRRSLVTMHVRSHIGERLIACYHCGKHFATNNKLSDHLRRQNIDEGSEFHCSICGRPCASAYLAREHERQHVNAHACTLCDMTAPSLAALAIHLRYRHLPNEATHIYPCPHCKLKTVTKSDLKKHIRRRHGKETKIKREESDNATSDGEESDDSSWMPKKEEEPKRQYVCHMCPENEPKVFSRGNKLTRHLVNVHEVQWPCGCSRLRYQLCEDGMYRLITTRIEMLEVSEKIVDGYSVPKDSLSNTFEFDVNQKAEPTMTTPRMFELTVKNSDENVQNIKKENQVEIMMCDVDEKGNIISSEVMMSNVIKEPIN